MLSGSCTLRGRKECIGESDPYNHELTPVLSLKESAFQYGTEAEWKERLKWGKTQCRGSATSRVLLPILSLFARDFFQDVKKLEP